MSPDRFDTLIKNGTIIDGSGSEPFSADLGISGDKIVFIGKGVTFEDTKGTALKADTLIDANGLFVSPGFIDAHAHSEFTLLADPRAEGKVSQGITTEINGNCGLSGGPLLGEALRQRQAEIKESGTKEIWSTLGEYLEILKNQGLTMNFATLAGHGNIRASVVGYTDRIPSEAEMARMKALLIKSLKEGAIGLSTGLIYPPGIWAETRELVELCSAGISSGYPFIYASHIRSEGDNLLEAIDEVIEIAGKSGSKAHISHIKTSGIRNWHKADAVIDRINRARNQGICVTADRYPYTAGATDLDSVLPKWALEGGNEVILNRLDDAAVREVIRQELLQAASEDEDRWKRIVVSDVDSETNKWMEGLTLAEIAERLALEPAQALIEILRQERLRAGGIFHSMSEENLKKILSLPFVAVGSDSSARSKNGPTRKGKPHPRGFGSFTRFLGKYSIKEGLISLPEAIRKITSLPAEIFGLRQRGLLREGFYADIVVFDPGEIIDRATFEEPFNLSDGIKYVIVNGTVVFDENGLSGKLPGRVLKNGR